jgi:hypothetical protein
MSHVTNNPQWDAEALDFINDEVTARLARQSDAGTQIDSKAFLLVGYAGAAALFLASRHFQPVLGGLAFAAFAVAAGVGIWAYAVGTYEDPPDPRSLFSKYARRPKSDAVRALAAMRVKAFESNVPKHQRKALRWRVSLAVLMLGALLMVASLLVQTGSHGKSTGQHPAGPKPTATPATGGRPGRRECRHRPEESDNAAEARWTLAVRAPLARPGLTNHAGYDLVVVQTCRHDRAH